MPKTTRATLLYTSRPVTIK